MIRTMYSRDPGLKHYLQAIESCESLDAATERELVRAWRAGDAAAGDRLITANLRYTARIARKYGGTRFRMADLIAEGNVGLMEALERFDPDRNLRFMTYGAYWVRAMILSHILKNFSIVGLGSGPLQSKLFFRLQRERARLATKLGDDEARITGALAAKFGITEDTVRLYGQRLGAHDPSLDQAAFTDGPATLGDTLPDTEENVETRVADHERDQAVQESLNEIWHALSERERLILSERLLMGADGASLADLGRKLGVSRERVRQLEARLKTKLHAALLPLERAA